MGVFQPSPGVLTRMGFTKTTMKLGDLLKVEGFGAKDGSNNADARALPSPMDEKCLLGAPTALRNSKV